MCRLVLGDGGEFVQVRAKKLGSVDVVARIELFVCRVRTVIAPADGQEEDIETEDVGKVERDGDGTTLADVVGRLAPHRLGRLVRGPVRVVLTPVSTVASSLVPRDTRTLGSVSHGSPPCVRYASHRFFEPIFLNSSSMYLTTSSVVFLIPRLGTSRIENLPLTEHGITVLDPGAAGYNQLCLATMMADIAYRKRPRFRGATSSGFLHHCIS